MDLPLILRSKEGDSIIEREFLIRKLSLNGRTFPNIKKLPTTDDTTDPYQRRYSDVELYKSGVKSNALYFYSNQDSVYAVLRKEIEYSSNNIYGAFSRRSINMAIEKIIQLKMFSGFSRDDIFPRLKIQGSNRKFLVIPLFILPVFLGHLDEESRLKYGKVSLIMKPITNIFERDYNISKITNVDNFYFATYWQLYFNTIRYIETRGSIDKEGIIENYVRKIVAKEIKSIAPESNEKMYINSGIEDVISEEEEEQAQKLTESESNAMALLNKKRMELNNKRKEEFKRKKKEVKKKKKPEDGLIMNIMSFEG